MKPRRYANVARDSAAKRPSEALDLRPHASDEKLERSLELVSLALKVWERRKKLSGCF